MTYLYVTITAYLIGSIPFGLIIAQAMGLGDVRKIGSGNIGATNVLRTGNKGAAVATLLLDGFKGFLPVFLCNHYAPSLSGLALLMAIIGHCFPIWLKFKGGKGVATYIGAVLGLYWPMGLIAAAIWLGGAFLTRISSLSALIMVVVMIIASLFLTPYYSLWLALAALLIIYKHKANISRMLNKSEPKIGHK